MKTFVLRLTALVVCIIGNLTIHAYDFEIDGFQYEIISYTDFTCRISKYVGEDSIITIPSEVSYLNKDLKIVAIGANAFYNRSSIISVDIPSSIESIGSYCFSGCKSLEKVNLPSTLHGITSGMFYKCSILKNIALPNDLKVIGQYAFYGCSLKECAIPNGVTSIGEGAFMGNSFDTFKCPENIKELTKSVLSNCKNLKTLYLPMNLTEIGESALSGCSSLEKIQLPDSLKTLSANAFENCSALKSIEIPSSINTLSPCLFKGCNSLENVKLNDGLKTISYGVFNNCSSLKEITFPGTLTTIVQKEYYSYKNQSNGKIEWAYRNDLFEKCPINNMKIEYGDSLTFWYLYNDGSKYNLLQGSSIPSTVKEIYIDKERYVGGSSSLVYNVPNGSNRYVIGAIHEYKELEDLSFSKLEILELGPHVKSTKFLYWNFPNLKKIVCHSMIPPTFPYLSTEENDYLKKAYTTIQVVVPNGAIENYRRTSVWANFWNMEEDPTLIDNIIINHEDYSNDPIEVYNLNGVKVGNSKENLTSGIYIIRQGNKVDKIMIK